MEVILSLTERAVVFHQGKVIARGSPRDVGKSGGDRSLSRQARGQGRRRPTPSRGGAARHERPPAPVRILPSATAILSASPMFRWRLPPARRRVARLQWRRQDDDVERDRRPGSGGGRARVSRPGDRRPGCVFHRRQGLALSPEGWRLFVQQTVEQNLRLGATVLRDKAGAGTAGAGVRPVSAPVRASPATRRHFVGWRAADARHRPCADERPEAADAGRARSVWRRRWWRRCTRPCNACNGRA